MADAPIWAMGGEEALSKSILEVIVVGMRDNDGMDVPASVFRSKAAMIDFIRERSRAYWDERQRQAGKPGGGRVMRAITASECNEFLRSLPPLPLYGEPGCPFNPARMEAEHG